MGCFSRDSMLWWPFNQPRPAKSPPSSPVQQIVASETEGTKKKKKPFGQAQRPQDLGMLRLGTAGKLGAGYEAMDKARSMFG